MEIWDTDSDNQCPFPIIKYRSYLYYDKSKNFKLNLADSQAVNDCLNF